jgi:hypothetical protein
VGYIIGPELAALNFSGSIIAWGLLIPLLIFFLGPQLHNYLPPGSTANGGWLDLANACWRGERPDGRADVQCYSTQFNRYLRGTIKFYQGANVVAEGDSVFSWDPSAHVIVYNQWASNGGFGLGEIAIEGNDLVFRTRLPDGAEAPARAVWRRVDKDTFRVIRQRRNDEGEGWTDDTSVTYKRVAS